MGVIGVPPHANNTHKTQFIEIIRSFSHYFSVMVIEMILSSVSAVIPCWGSTAFKLVTIHAFDHFTENSIATIQAVWAA